MWAQVSFLWYTVYRQYKGHKDYAVSFVSVGQESVLSGTSECVTSETGG